MQRMKFLEPGDHKKVECYLLAPKFKIDKERQRICTLLFSVKMSSGGADD